MMPDLSKLVPFILIVMAVVAIISFAIGALIF